jgi:hypothetical protein
MPLSCQGHDPLARSILRSIGQSDPACNKAAGGRNRMASKGVHVQVVDASWIERFAGRLLQLFPSKHPLDAVRTASESFLDSSHLPPETAAEIYAVEPSPMDSGAPDSRRKTSSRDRQ